jgi:hypothetical protein
MSLLSRRAKLLVLAVAALEIIAVLWQSWRT